MRKTYLHMFIQHIYLYIHIHMSSEISKALLPSIGITIKQDYSVAFLKILKFWKLSSYNVYINSTEVAIEWQFFCLFTSSCAQVLVLALHSEINHKKLKGPLGYHELNLGQLCVRQISFVLISLPHIHLVLKNILVFNHILTKHSV